MQLQKSNDFEVVGWKTVLKNIFGVPRVANTKNYPKPTGYVMLVEVADNY